MSHGDHWQSIFGEQYEDVDIPIYATKEALEGDYIPSIGDDVNGMMWMQGRVRRQGLDE